MRVLDLFSGIGGFSLGLEAAGMETMAFCEVDPFCRSVLAQHWPKVPIYDDVRTLTADAIRRDGLPPPDVICGGFPCQDISFAGKRAGLEGARSGLWGEYRRLIGELRPRFVVVENVTGLLSLGLGTVLADLSALGYDATWDCVPASAVGAPHRRDRIWIVAYAGSEQHEGDSHAQRWAATVKLHEADDSDAEALHRVEIERCQSDGDHARAGDVADTHQQSWHQGRTRHAAQEPGGRNADRSSEQPDLRDANVSGLALRESQPRDVGEKLASTVGADWWLVEPDVGRVADGVPARVDRLKSLGNAVVPAIPELIGRAIMRAVNETAPGAGPGAE